MPVVDQVDAKLIARAHEEISRSASALIFDEPFFGHLLSGINRRVTTEISTAAVGFEGGQLTLFVNPEFFVKTITRKAERVGIIKHEVLHLLFKHVFRGDWERIDRHLFNIAADLVVNQFIGSKWKLPESAITLATFPELDLLPDQTVQWYYKQLLTAAEEISRNPDHPCGSGEHWGLNGEADEAMAGHALGRLVQGARDRSPRGYANLPNPIKQLVDAAIAELEPSVDWRRVLRMFTNSSRRSMVKNTLRRPSKRYGTYPGLKVKRFCRLLVAVDTSGSISDEHLSEFFAEIKGMWRQGAEITVIECDEIVQRVWQYTGGPPPSSVGGRGGTAFDPVFRWANEQSTRFDGLIYLTDGYAMTPLERPRCNTLWVLTPEGSDETLTFGRVTQIS